MIFEYELPWFPKELNPNARVHFRKKNDFFQAYKEECACIARRACPKTSKDRRELHIVFHPPCARRRDLDNCYAAMKAGLDGIAMACGINDSQFRPVTLDFGEKVKGGRVNIRITKNATS